MKLHNTNPLYSRLVDKSQVREFVKTLIGEQYLIPLYGVYDSWEQIDFSALPSRFVMKTTHDSGGIGIVKDKEADNLPAIKTKLTKRLRQNYYWKGREIPYRNAITRIIIEEYMVDESGEDLKDYKFWCFNGEPKYIQVDSGRYTYHCRDFYDLNWEHQPFVIGYPTREGINARPENLEEMIATARKLSAGIPFVRVDLYNINGRIYFGEMTFHPDGGIEQILPKQWNSKLGNLLHLPS